MRLIITIAVFIMSTTASAADKDTIFNADIPDKQTAKDADSYFKSKDYQMSFPKYLSLAKIGDKYSQYMVAVHYENGLSVTKNINKAYAWANLAKSNGDSNLKKYYTKLEGLISTEEAQQAEDIKRDIYAKYNNLSLAVGMKKRIKNTIPKCSGSRIRGNCTTVKVYCLFESTQSAKEKCAEAALLRKPKALAELKSRLATVDNYIKEEAKRKGKVIVVENNDDGEGNK